MKFHCILLLLLVAVHVRGKSVLPEGFTIEGLEGIDLNSLLNDDDEARQMNQLNAIADRLKTIFQGTLRYLQNVPQYLSKVIRRPTAGGGGSGSGSGSGSSIGGSTGAISSAVDNMMASGSELSPSIVSPPSGMGSGNGIGHFFRQMASRVPWANALGGGGGGPGNVQQQKHLMQRLAGITRFLNYSKLLAGPLHRLSARNSAVKRTSAIARPPTAGGDESSLLGPKVNEYRQQLPVVVVENNGNHLQQQQQQQRVVKRLHEGLPFYVHAAGGFY